MFITKSNRLLRKILIIVSFLTVYAVIFSISNSSAYWIDSITTLEEEVISMEIQIGEWDFDDDGKGPSEPQPQPYDDFNLNEWEENDSLDRTIPQGQMIVYNDKIFIVTGSGYNPQWHGVPGSSGSNWAYVIVELEWEPGHDYRENSVVTRNGKWYITSDIGKNIDFKDDPETSSGGGNKDAWREIAPLSEGAFGYFPSSTIKDYTLSNRDDVVTYL